MQKEERKKRVEHFLVIILWLLNKLDWLQFIWTIYLEIAFLEVVPVRPHIWYKLIGGNTL